MARLCGNLLSKGPLKNGLICLFVVVVVVILHGDKLSIQDDIDYGQYVQTYKRFKRTLFIRTKTR